MKFHRGFTLVELLMVVMVLAIAGTAIVSMQGNLFARQSNVSAAQVQTQLELECAEQIFAVRKYQDDGYSTIASGSSYGTNACGGITALGSNPVASVTITDPYSGSACPLTGNCKLVVISQGGATPLTLMLVDY